MISFFNLPGTLSYRTWLRDLYSSSSLNMPLSTRHICYFVLNNLSIILSSCVGHVAIDRGLVIVIVFCLCFVPSHSHKSTGPMKVYHHLSFLLLQQLDATTISTWNMSGNKVAFAGLSWRRLESVISTAPTFTRTIVLTEPVLLAASLSGLKAGLGNDSGNDTMSELVAME
jgi:hypothetical protein